jgi:hypothetical protein
MPDKRNSLKNRIFEQSNLNWPEDQFKHFMKK